MELLESVRGLKKITRWPPYSITPRPSPGLPHTTLVDTTLLPAGPAPRPRGSETIAGPLTRQGVFELRDRAEDLEEHPPNRDRGIDALIEHHQIHPANLQLVQQLDEVLQRPAEPVELRHDELVARTQPAQGLIELGRRARFPEASSVKTACSRPRSARRLGPGIFVAGRDPRSRSA